MIQVEITPYTQMTLASMDRDLLVVIITVVTGLMLLFFAGCELRIDSRSEDLRQPARSLQYRMAEPTAMRYVHFTSTFRKKTFINLPRRLVAMQWPKQETDRSQGMELATIRYIDLGKGTIRHIRRRKR